MAKQMPYRLAFRRPYLIKISCDSAIIERYSAKEISRICTLRRSSPRAKSVIKASKARHGTVSFSSRAFSTGRLSAFRIFFFRSPQPIPMVSMAAQNTLKKDWSASSPAAEDNIGSPLSRHLVYLIIIGSPGPGVNIAFPQVSASRWPARHLPFFPAKITQISHQNPLHSAVGMGIISFQRWSVRPSR